MNREVYLNSIAYSLALLKNQVTLRNAINLYDINIVAEDFYPGLLNIILDTHLVNANTVEKNAPGIDLVDAESRIAIQVTADSSSAKIKHTIDEFIKNDSFQKYDRLIVLILTDKKSYRTTFDTKSKFSFDRMRDIWDNETLITKIRALEIDKLKKVYEFLQKELDSKCAMTENTEASEIDTIIDLIEFISNHKQVRKTIDVVVDPDYKIYRRFKEFANQLINMYKNLLTVYGTALTEIDNLSGKDEAQDLITMYYLQDLSMDYLNKADDDPAKAIDELTDFFDSRLSENGKKYDRMAIKFYLINELIKCSVFPNERSEYNGGKF